MYRYEEAALLEDLRAIRPSIRAAFAAACTERLYPLFEIYCRHTGTADAERFRSVLDSIWNHVANQHMMDASALAADAQWSKDFGPTDDSKWTDLNPYAENATAALFYTIRAYLSTDPQDCAWTARQAYESVDYYVHSTEETDFNESASETAVLTSPVVQRELRRQAEDLELLKSSSGNKPELVIAELRLRSRKESLFTELILSTM